MEVNPGEQAANDLPFQSDQTLLYPQPLSAASFYDVTGATRTLRNTATV
jgi:hypothetical protein